MLDYACKGTAHRKKYKMLHDLQFTRQVCLCAIYVLYRIELS